MPRLNLQAISGEAGPSVTRALRELDSRTYAVESLFARVIKNASIVASHADLQNLDYASSGHTGFASSAQLTAHTGNTSNPHTTTLQQAIAAGATATSEPTFNGGIDLGTSGVVQSNVADGASAIAYDMNDQTTRTQGYAMELREGTILKEVVTWDGRFAFGYSTSLAPQTGHVLSFLSSDSNSPAGAPTYVGILGAVTHTDTGETVPRLYGVAGLSDFATVTGLTPTISSGLLGCGSSQADSSSLSSAYLAGVVGTLSGTTTLNYVEVATPDTTLVTYPPKGNFAHATCFWANYIYTAETKGLPTNRPAIASSLRAPIQGWSSTTGEQWGVYGEAPSSSGSITPAIAGFARIPFPARGTRKTHLYFIATAAASGGPTGNAKGDVYFDDGTNEPEGLWEHDGTAWRYLLNQHAYNADVTSTAATLGGIGASGPAAAAQGGWIQIKVDDGTAGGATVWIPWWV